MTAKAVFMGLVGHSNLAGSLWRELDQRYSDGQRAYHNWHHIDECLVLLRRYEEQVQILGSAIRFAVIYHDAIYEPGRNDNERLSAELAVGHIRSLGGPDATAARVDALIMATAHFAGEEVRDEDAAVMRDIDLGILGAPRERFLQYDEQIRAEYTAVPREQFRDGRRRILRGFLERDRIYRSDYFHRLLEHRARENIASMLRAITSSESPYT